MHIISSKLSRNEIFNAEIAELVPYLDMNGQEYCTKDAMVYSRQELQELSSAAEGVDQVYLTTLRYVQRNVPDEVLAQELHIDPRLIPCARQELSFHVMARQDWILYEGQMKFIENNADTPTGVPESFFIPSYLIENDIYQKEMINHHLPVNIANAFATAVNHYRSAGLTGKIVFSCHQEHTEDYANTRFVQSCAESIGIHSVFADLSELTVQEGAGLFLGDEKIDIWYRLYPLELLVFDEDSDGTPVGEQILDLIEKGLLGIINPIQSIIMQSKSFYKFIWTLYENNDTFGVFNHYEASIISKYFLPTYGANDIFLSESTSFVEKAVYGREGRGVTLTTVNDGKIVATQTNSLDEYDSYYNTQPKIYQLKLGMTKFTLSIGEEPKEGYLLTGAYVINGRFSGLLTRLGDLITGDLSYFCASFTENN
ncbi:glutathionylspermidine synthase [Fontibacillus solani]|uniref:Glutathionylspermidine synthase n=1 Tax=Fontibacillus solani TaxID=1572857 RepID=A0A7W3SPJ0_9BACL|nr:glutathionylspermidine synthase family protein [Fontibacillus solani]MBA9083722.1 glutathionylspermidine synthase [Fontibacillus solani]